ncbi:MAG: hypothetical protein JSV94_06910 [Methanobacteriota archaeon]|nr:MAG: hypothetical protein JSV94_06910 [Euryarchaeota archaeon]
MRKRSLLILVSALALSAIVVAPGIDAYNNGVGSSDLEYDCGGSCHNEASTCTITMSASNETPSPGDTITVCVEVSGGEASGSPLGVQIVSCTTTSNSLPSDDGWTIISDPSGTTTYNYYEVDSYQGSLAISWQLSAPSTTGWYILYAREFHGDGGVYATDYSAGLAITVTDWSNGGEPPTNGEEPPTNGEEPVNVPVVLITSPSNSATVEGNITVNANVISVDAITCAILKIDGEVVSEKTEPPFTWTVDTTNLTEGGHVLLVTVVDSTGDKVDKEIAVFVDNESELVPMFGWILTMAAGTIVIITGTAMLIVLALYLRKRTMERRSR